MLTPIISLRHLSISVESWDHFVAVQIESFLTCVISLCVYYCAARNDSLGRGREFCLFFVLSAVSVLWELMPSVFQGFCTACSVACWWYFPAGVALSYLYPQRSLPSKNPNTGPGVSPGVSPTQPICDVPSTTKAFCKPMALTVCQPGVLFQRVKAFGSQETLIKYRY